MPLRPPPVNLLSKASTWSSTSVRLFQKGFFVFRLFPRFLRNNHLCFRDGADPLPRNPPHSLFRAIHLLLGHGRFLSIYASFGGGVKILVEDGDSVHHPRLWLTPWNSTCPLVAARKTGLCLTQAVRLHLDEAEKMGTLEQILEEAGHIKPKNQN